MKKDVTVRSSAAEYLTFITASGESQVEAIYFDENVWLTQKMMGVLYDVEANTITYHLQKAFRSLELDENSVTRKFRVTASDGKSYDTTVYNFKGVMEICRWSKQPKADMVMEALYDMAESVARTGFYSVLPDQELIDLLVKRQSENPTFLREAAVDLKSKKALEQLAQDAQLRELWKQRAELPLGEYKSKLDVICNGNFTLLSKEIKKYEKWYTAFKARKVDYSL